MELYARFTSSLNFAAWFAARRRPVAHLIAPWPWQQGQGQGAGAGAAGAEGAAGTEGDTEAGMASWFASASKVGMAAHASAAMCCARDAFNVGSRGCSQAMAARGRSDV